MSGRGRATAAESVRARGAYAAAAGPLTRPDRRAAETAHSQPPPVGLLELTEVRFVLASSAVFVLAVLCQRLQLDLAVAVAALGVSLMAGCLTLPLRWAAASGVCAWAYLTGFVVNEGGQLTFSTPDLLRAGLMVAIAAVASLVGGGPHHPSPTAAATGSSMP